MQKRAYLERVGRGRYPLTRKGEKLLMLLSEL
jgi:hypothetical protein